MEVADFQRVAIGQGERGFCLPIGLDPVELVDDEIECWSASAPGCRGAVLMCRCSRVLGARVRSLRAFVPSCLRDCGWSAREDARRASASFTSVPPGSLRTASGSTSSRRPEIRRMPQPAVVSPLGEPHLRHELRRDPVGVSLVIGGGT